MPAAHAGVAGTVSLRLCRKVPDNALPTDRLSSIHRLSRATLAAIWIYHGLVPKFLFRDWSEMALLGDMGLDVQLLPSALTTAAYLEIALGLLILANWRSRWPLWATIGAMLGALIGVARYSPQVLHAAFNPVTLNGAAIALALIALWSMREVTNDK